jgi:hypothetical protein
MSDASEITNEALNAAILAKAESTKYSRPAIRTLINEFLPRGSLAERIGEVPPYGAEKIPQSERAKFLAKLEKL